MILEFALTRGEEVTCCTCTGEERHQHHNQFCNEWSGRRVGSEKMSLRCLRTNLVNHRTALLLVCRRVFNEVARLKLTKQSFVVCSERCANDLRERMVRAGASFNIRSYATFQGIMTSSQSSVEADLDPDAGLDLDTDSDPDDDSDSNDEIPKPFAGESIEWRRWHHHVPAEIWKKDGEELLVHTAVRRCYQNYRTIGAEWRVTAQKRRLSGRAAKRARVDYKETTTSKDGDEDVDRRLVKRKRDDADDGAGSARMPGLLPE